MKILHIYPKDDNRLARYVSMLCQSSVPGTEMISANDVKSFKQLYKEQHPAIIHQHGCKPSDMVQAVSSVSSLGARIVITPHGHLQPWNHKKLRGSILCQQVSKAYVLIARSPMEADSLARLQWNPRLETVSDPTITRASDQASLCRQMALIYQKVMRSDVLALMNDDTRQILQVLLKAAITGDHRWTDIGDTDMAAVDWLQLLLYADYEGVTSLLERGWDIMALPYPKPAFDTTPAAHDAYLPSRYTRPQPQAGKSLTELVKAVYKGTQEDTISLLLLAETDMALRRPDIDEEMLVQELSENKMLPFFASLLQVLSEQTGLDEGFMPCPPKDDQTTEQIRTVIDKHLKI
jgi:hypothetical protein